MHVMAALLNPSFNARLLPSKLPADGSDEDTWDADGFRDPLYNFSYPHHGGM